MAIDDEFLFQPEIYTTGAHTTLFDVLDKLWSVEDDNSGGTYFVVSGFGTHNGGVRFFERFRSHISNGGRVRVILGGSRSTSLSSRQLGKGLIDCGAEVSVILRNRILHAKLYGAHTTEGESLVISSGNFTGPGLSLNLESTMAIGPGTTSSCGFSWDDLFAKILAGSFSVFDLTNADSEDPAWALLYDEERGSGFRPVVDTDVPEFESLILTLSHADTARITATPGTSASLGSQYFWLSKDAYDFFPPLVIRNVRGSKATYSAEIDVNFEDLGVTEVVKVTFEAENNLDFRLGTGPLRATNLADDGDMAIITRRGERSYDLRLLRQGSTEFISLSRFALQLIGHRGKRYGFAPNAEVDRILRP